MDDQIMTADSPTPSEHRGEIAVAFQPFHRLREVESDSGREGLATLGPTTVDQGAARAGAHAGAESVLHVATAVVGLECPLHD